MIKGKGKWGSDNLLFLSLRLLWLIYRVSENGRKMFKRVDWRENAERKQIMTKKTFVGTGTIELETIDLHRSVTCVLRSPATGSPLLWGLCCAHCGLSPGGEMGWTEMLLKGNGITEKSLNVNIWWTQGRECLICEAYYCEAVTPKISFILWKQVLLWNTMENSSSMASDRQHDLISLSCIYFLQWVSKKCPGLLCCTGARSTEGTISTVFRVCLLQNCWYGVILWVPPWPDLKLHKVVGVFC